MLIAGGRGSDPAVVSSQLSVLEGIEIMNLAYGYVAQTLQTHDELVAAGINEQRRIAAARAGRGERSGGRPRLVQRLSERMHARGARGLHGARAAH
jgi:hypothetical protein